MALSKGFHTVALKLQESATALSLSNIQQRLNDCLGDLNDGQYRYIVDVFGDDESGDVVYSCGGDLLRASYEFFTVNGKPACTIDTENAVDVLPHTVYEEEADEGDQMAGMAEADRILAANMTSAQRRMLLGERFISKDERSAASSGDFAGTGKSFPILKPGDVMAAVHSIGRGVAGGQSAASIKAGIIRIAKRKGWTKYLPAAWQASQSSPSNEGEKRVVKGDLVLVESASEFLELPKLKESARTDYPVKLIAPGKGSSAYYPAEVLERDGPKVFKAGTHMYWNHPTKTEESERPEGNLDHLAAVLTTNAYYDANGTKGPGLYARAKVFSDHAQQVEEKGSYIGLSIRAGGNVEAGGKTKEGRPVLKELTYAESTDFVTKAGAGGMVLTESAIPAKEGADDMDAAELDKKIKEAVTPLTEQLATVQTENRKLRERAAASEAVADGTRILNGLNLAEGVRERVLARCVANVPLTKDGDLDTPKFKERLEAEAKDEAAYISKITGGARVSGMGAPAEAKEPLTEAQQLKESSELMAKNLGRLGMSNDAVKRVTGIDEGRAA